MPTRKHPRRKYPAAPRVPPADPRGERLQKVLAAAGIASRRECEQIVLEGRVDVDGEVVTQLGTRVDPTRQVVRVDGTALPRPRLVYFALNKPQGVVTTARDPWARTRTIDLLPDNVGRVFAVGRLDMSSEGLVLLTNDGDLANRLAHPRYGIEKTYLVQAAGEVDQEVIEKLLRGVWVAEGRVRPERVTIDRRYKQSTILHVVLREGKNREIRRILAALGHKVQRLRRIAIGPLTLGDLALGQSRPLAREEIRRLQEAAHREPTPSRHQPSVRPNRPPTVQNPAVEESRPSTATPARDVGKIIDYPAAEPTAGRPPRGNKPYRKERPRRGQTAGRARPDGQPGAARFRNRRGPAR